MSCDGKFNTQTPVSFNDLYICPPVDTAPRIQANSSLPPPINDAHDCRQAFALPFGFQPVTTKTSDGIAVSELCHVSHGEASFSGLAEKSIFI
jgi:hypothetical protein